MNEKQSVPAAALRFAGEFELGDNGESSKTAPFSMVARSGDSIEHWYWGKVIHDLSGMHTKRSKVAIDYEHDPKEIIGYANHFSTEDGDLKVQGTLTPTKFNTRATEIVELSRQGVPFEASINFGGDGIRVEKIDEGSSVEVNGRNFSGPGVVIREWPLRGIAVTPYGADSNTSTTFNQDSTIEVEVIMANDTLENTVVVEEEEVKDLESVEATTDHDSVEAAESAVETPHAEEEAEPVLAAASSLTQSVQSVLQTYYDKFGSAGYEYARDGLALPEALERHMAAQSAEIADLRK